MRKEFQLHDPNYEWFRSVIKSVFTTEESAFDVAIRLITAWRDEGHQIHTLKRAIEWERQVHK